MSDKHSQAFLPPMEAMPVAKTPTQVPQCQVSADAIVERALVLLRRSVAERGYTLDALEAATGKGRTHIHRMLNGDRPLTLQFLASLPADLKADFAKRAAEALGLIVVTPLEGQEAVRAVVSGLVGLLVKGAA